MNSIGWGMYHLFPHQFFLFVVSIFVSCVSPKLLSFSIWSVLRFRLRLFSALWLKQTFWGHAESRRIVYACLSFSRSIYPIDIVDSVHNILQWKNSKLFASASSLIGSFPVRVPHRFQSVRRDIMWLGNSTWTRGDSWLIHLKLPQSRDVTPFRVKWIKERYVLNAFPPISCGVLPTVPSTPYFSQYPLTS